jgi:transcriptional regulator with GAF, ATPase, and Fis domain
VAENQAEPERAGRSRESNEEQNPAPASGNGSGGSGGAGNLGEMMGQVARSLHDQHHDVEATLQAITSAAVGTIPGVEYCTVTCVTGRRKVKPRASTGELPRKLGELQDRIQEGPCLDAVWEEKTVRIQDMRTESRWPQFAAEATRLGVLSAVSFQLFVTGDNLGALDVYACTPHAFGEESEDVGRVFAAHAAVALSSAQDQQELLKAVTSRDLIGQAKGILMERYKLTADQAFNALARVSQQTNRKLVDIARELTETGALPALPTRQD